MSRTICARVVAAPLAALLVAQLTPAIALADSLHNITYRVRIDGVSRGATIVYNVSDTDVETANPTMLPGQTFEADAVLADPQHAGMQISIRWPYTANLHCEILVDDAVTAQADEFIAPRFLPQSNDPGYGAMPCGGQLANAAAISAAGNPSVGAPPNGGAPPN